MITSRISPWTHPGTSADRVAVSALSAFSVGMTTEIMSADHNA